MSEDDASIVSVYAPSWDPYDSYGQIACRLARHLDVRGVYVNAMHSNGEVAHDAQPDDVRAVVTRPIRPVLGGIQLGYPTHYTRRGALAYLGPQVAVTMFESTVLPSGWAAALNRCQAVVVPSRWQVDVFRDNGVRVPIHVVPLGIDEVYQPLDERRDGEPYTFLAFADRGRRKNWHLVVHAFVQAFGDDPRYHLILKTRAGSNVPDWNNPNIETLRADLTPEDMNALYNRCDCMVFPSSGEGFGLPPREFAATGGHVIATGWGGMDDVGAWGLPLFYSMGPAWEGHPDHEGLGEWAVPEQQHLVELMRYASLGPIRHNELTPRFVARIHHLYDWQYFADRVLDIWRDVSKEQGHAGLQRLPEHQPGWAVGSEARDAGLAAHPG